MKIQMWDIAKVIPYARNARKIPEAAVDKVAASIKEFGFRQPIVVDEKGVIIAGHTRLLAAQKLGMKEVPVHVAEGLTKAQIKAYRLMDNRSHQGTSWDEALLGVELVELKDLEFDLELTGFEGYEINQYLNGGSPDNPEDHWKDMPEFEQEDLTSFQAVHVHFKNQQDVDQFARLIGQKILPATRSLWFPPAEIGHYADKRYAGGA